MVSKMVRLPAEATSKSVIPAKAVILPPNEVAVPAIVIALLANFPLAMLPAS